MDLVGPLVVANLLMLTWEPSEVETKAEVGDRLIQQNTYVDEPRRVGVAPRCAGRRRAAVPSRLAGRARVVVFPDRTCGWKANAPGPRGSAAADRDRHNDRADRPGVPAGLRVTRSIISGGLAQAATWPTEADTLAQVEAVYTELAAT